VVVSAQANDGGFAIYRVNKVQQPLQSDSKLRANQARQVADLSAQTEAAAYFESVKERAGVKQINSVK
jgi:peptidyl-prolyl cis-trans isomerase D